MGLTRSQKKEALAHIINIAWSDDGSDKNTIGQQFLKSNNWNKPNDFLSLTYEELDHLDYPLPNGTLVSLDSKRRNGLKRFKWYCEIQTSDHGIYFQTLEEYTNITDDQWDEFEDKIKRSEIIPPYDSSYIPPSSRGNGGSSGTVQKVNNPVQDFQKTIKRDMSSFKELKDEKHWDTWQRSTKAIARAQDVFDVLNPVYVPKTAEEKSLFESKNRYMYAVAELTLKTDFGKTCVRSHEHTGNAQLVYKELFEYMEKSTKASLSSQSLLAYITSARMGDGSWKGTAHSFILHWQNQVRIYHSLIALPDKFSDNVLLQMLQNSVHPIEELRQVKNQADQYKTTTGNALSYDEYCNLLLSAAQQYDHALSGKKGRHPAWLIHEHMFSHESNDYQTDDGESYDIDYDVDTIIANKHQSLKPQARLPKDQWFQLTPEGRDHWRQMSEGDKKAILTLLDQKQQKKNHATSR
jgi:hypothetical protein